MKTIKIIAALCIIAAVAAGIYQGAKEATRNTTLEQGTQYVIDGLFNTIEEEIRNER